MDAKHTPLMLLLIAIILGAMVVRDYMEPADNGCCTECTTPPAGSGSDTVFVVPGDTVMVTGADSLMVKQATGVDRSNAARLVLHDEQ